MANISYLWTHRAKFPVHTKAFYAAWAKRLLTIRSVLKRNKYKSRAVRKGAVISSTAEFATSQIEGKYSNLSVGNETMVGACSLMVHDKLVIGNHVCINSDVKIITASHGINDPEWKTVCKPVFIDDFAWIATGAMILPGVKIGKGAVVGAGAVVSRDVAPFDIVAGNPAVSIGKKRTEDLRYSPCAFLAGNLAWLKG